MDQSLKNKTRQKRAATSVEYEIHSDYETDHVKQGSPVSFIHQAEADIHVSRGATQVFFK